MSVRTHSAALVDRLGPVASAARIEGYAFRLGALLGQPALIDATLRLFSASVMPTVSRGRFLFSGQSASDLEATLGRIRSLADWPGAWVSEAKRQERLARGADPASAFEHWRAAALAYHFALAVAPSGNAEISPADLGHAKVRAFTRAAQGLDPVAEPVSIRWRQFELPGYLRRPSNAPTPRPLVVLFNGASTVKEEMTLWSAPFLERGLATLAFDGPGSGEMRGRIAVDVGQEDITASILDLADADARLDRRRVALLGVSFGGALAVHHAARNHDVAALVAVTPPFHPPKYIRNVRDLVVEEIAVLCGVDATAIRARSADLSCVPFVGDVRCPALVVAAGRDVILPASEARRLYDRLPGSKTLLYMRQASHVGISHIDLWTSAAADWLAARL